MDLDRILLESLQCTNYSAFHSQPSSSWAALTKFCDLIQYPEEYSCILCCFVYQHFQLHFCYCWYIMCRTWYETTRSDITNNSLHRPFSTAPYARKYHNNVCHETASPPSNFDTCCTLRYVMYLFHFYTLSFCGFSFRTKHTSTTEARSQSHISLVLLDSLATSSGSFKCVPRTLLFVECVKHSAYCNVDLS